MPYPLLFEDHEVIPRLSQLQLPREVLRDVLDKAVGERAAVTISDPSGTAGLEMRRWCTRFLRDDLRLKELGWVACKHNQVEGIRNDVLELKVAFMNTDARTGMLSKMPHSVSEKGSVTQHFINQNSERYQGQLFEDAAPEPDPISNYDFWYLCSHVCEKHVAAEFSRPISLTNGIVDDYSERVIIWQPGEKEGISKPGAIPEDFAEVELPTLVRRQ